MNILVAIDFSDGFETILSEAKKWTHFTHAKLWLIHVLESQLNVTGFCPDVGFMGEGMAVDVFAANSQAEQNMRDTAASQLREKRYQLQELAEKLQSNSETVIPLLLEGPVSKTILKEASKHEVSMIIVGSHGHGPVRQLLMGSVSEAVLRKSPVPVLVVPTHRAERK
jgi:nucleotide-binding universal stress UspA family protein